MTDEPGPMPESGTAGGSGASAPDGVPFADAPAAEWAPPPPPAGDLPRHVAKPWGSELIWAWTSRYVGKVLTIDAGKRLSLQYHERKDEWIQVLDGRLRLTLANDDGVPEDRELGPGEGAHIATGRVHRFEAVESCRVLEVSTPELDDVVRIEDDFGRQGTSTP